MKLLSRVLCLLGILTIISSSRAQPIIWTFDAPFESDSKLATDSASNLYVVSIGLTTNRAVVVARRFDRNGVLRWVQQADVTPSIGQGFVGAVNDLKISASKVYACVFTDSLSNVPQTSIVSFDLSDGTPVVRKLSSIKRAGSIAAGPNHLAVVGRDGDLDFFVEYLNPSTLATLSSALITSNAAFAVDLVMDAKGDTYTSISRLGDTPLLCRIQPNASIVWSRTVDVPGQTNESVFDLAIDSSQNRIFVVGFTSSDSMVGIYSMSGGTLINIGDPTNTSTSSFSHVLPIGGSGAIVATAASPVRLFRITSSGQLVWLSSTVTANAAIPNNGLQFDPNGDIALSYVTDPSSANVRRYDIDTGNTINVLTFPRISPSQLTGAALDPSGSSYLLFDLETSVRLLRAQAADLIMPTLPATGGFPASARVQLATPATSQQAWLLSSSNTSVATVPAAVIINGNSISATFSITTFPVAANSTVSIFARNGGLVVAKALTVLAPSLQFTKVTPQVSIGGTPLTGVVQITGPAPTGGRTVALSVNKPEVASVQGSVNVAAGGLVSSFPVNTVGVNANQGVVLTATMGSVSKTFFFAVNAPSLVSLTGPSSIVGGTQGTMTLTIDGVAPAGGRSILLISGAPGIVIVPSSFAVPQGLTTVDVPMSTAVVSSDTNVVVFATRAGIIKTATVTVTP